MIGKHLIGNMKGSPSHNYFDFKTLGHWNNVHAKIWRSIILAPAPAGFVGPDQLHLVVDQQHQPPGLFFCHKTGATRQDVNSVARQ